MRIAKEKHQRDSQKIADLVSSGMISKAKSKQRAYIHSSHAKLVAANKATRIPGGLPCDRFPTIFARAQMLGFHARGGHAHVWQSRKAGGGLRIKAQFGDTDKAQQRLLANALLPFFGSHPGQYGRRGRDPAVETLRTQVEKAGSDDVFVHADVLQFYDNMSHEWLRENAPLPASLASWMFYSGYTVSNRATRCQAQLLTAEALQELPRRGLPQGSTLSPFVAELVIRGIISEVGPLQQHPLVNYSDNFGLICSAQEADRLEQTLREGFRSHPAGPFHLRISKRPLREENRFLGYSFRRDDRGKCCFWVREADWRSRSALYLDKLNHIPMNQIPKVIEKMEGYWRAWPAWPQREGAKREWEQAASLFLEVRGCEHLIPEGYSPPVEYEFGDIEAYMEEF